MWHQPDLFRLCVTRLSYCFENHLHLNMVQHMHWMHDRSFWLSMCSYDIVLIPLKPANRVCPKSKLFFLCLVNQGVFLVLYRAVCQNVVLDNLFKQLLGSTFFFQFSEHGLKQGNVYCTSSTLQCDLVSNGHADLQMYHRWVGGSFACIMTASVRCSLLLGAPAWSTMALSF